MKNVSGSLGGPLLGALVAAAAGWVACVSFLPGDGGGYATTDFLLAGGVAALGAALGGAVAAVLGRSPDGSASAAALVVGIGGTLGFLVPWVTAAAAYDETGLFMVGAIMLAVAGVAILTVVALIALTLVRRARGRV